MDKLYVLIDGKKSYIPKEIVERWGIKEGQFTIMGYPILSDVKGAGKAQDRLSTPCRIPNIANYPIYNLGGEDVKGELIANG